MVRIIDKIIEGDHETILEVTTEETVIWDKGIEVGVVVEIIVQIMMETVLWITIEEVVILI